MPRIFSILLLIVLLAGFSLHQTVRAVVDLLYFIATPGTVSIILTWETATEFDNIGFYIHRRTSVEDIYTRISPLILSSGDPLTGQLYNYEDASVVIGVQYFYILEILNADSTSEFTTPVSASIAVPTSTPTYTPTRTLAPVLSPSATTTYTPISSFTASITPTSNLPTSTVTQTLVPTVTATLTPTTTLEPLLISGNKFPAQTSTISPAPVSDFGLDHSNEVQEEGRLKDTLPDGITQSLIIITIILWLTLMVFLILTIRFISRDANQKM